MVNVGKYNIYTWILYDPMGIAMFTTENTTQLTFSKQHSNAANFGLWRVFWFSHTFSTLIEAYLAEKNEVETFKLLFLGLDEKMHHHSRG